jgi:hypothetical protein
MLWDADLRLTRDHAIREKAVQESSWRWKVTSPKDYRVH